MLPAARFTTLDPMPDVASPSPPTSVDLRPPDGPPSERARRRSTSADGPATADRPAAAVGSAAAPPPAAEPATTPPVKKRSQKFTRSRDGCLACRKIKQRCDATKPVCVRCVISSKECTWPLSVTQNAAAIAKGGARPPAKVVAAPAVVAPDTAPSPPPTARTDPAADRHRPFSDVSGPSSHAGATSTSSSASSVSPPAHAPMPLPAGAEVRRQQAIDNLLLHKTPTDQLQLCFPSPEERSLMSHFLGNGASLSQSIPSHLPILFLHPAQLVASPRGLSIPSDALLFSLLAMASTHQSSMHNLQRQGLMDNLVSLVNSGYPASAAGDPPPLQEHSQRSLALTLPTSPGAQEAQDRSRLLAAHLATTSHALLLSAIAMSGTASDLLISTALTLSLNSILAATRDWKPNLDVARKLLEMRGGPASMLADTRAAMGRGEADGSALMRTRAMLEYLVMMDMCDALGAGTAPRVMMEPFCPWWFDFVSMSQGPPGQAILDPSQAPSDWETVETILGVSRGLVELLNRTTILVAQCRDPNAAVGFHPAAPTSFEERLSRAQELLLELEIWKGEGDHQADPNVVLSRVQYGNLIWSHAIKILVLTDVLRVPHADPSVQESAYLGQQLLLQCNLANGQVVCLMWPAIIFGCLQMTHDTLGRNSTRTIIESMRDRCAWDVDAVLTTIHHVWSRRDRGEPDPTWREYQRESGLLFL